jgi:phosphatidylserine/phosphatidylglycerophosphate/cardiolipin synthase-like enzyme
MRTLSDALRMGRITAPFSVIGIQRYCPNGNAAVIAATLQTLNDEGATPNSIAVMLGILADGKVPSHTTDDMVDLVWTGPETPEAPSRDTAVVVRELFAAARQHVLVAGYAVYQGKEVFRVLAERMDACPELKVEMFLDIQRGHGDTTISADLVRRFAKRFRSEEWPGQRMPDIYYDPRALEMDRVKKAALHAKCIVVDNSVAFVSSANFTEAAQSRNIEVGALIKSPSYAARLVHHFHSLAAANLLVRVRV